MQKAFRHLNTPVLHCDADNANAETVHEYRYGYGGQEYQPAVPQRAAIEAGDEKAEVEPGKRQYPFRIVPIDKAATG